MTRLHIAPCADTACPSRGRCLRYAPDAPNPVDFERRPDAPACTCLLDPAAEPHERLAHARAVARELGER